MLMEAAGEKIFENLNLTEAPPIHCKGMPATLFEAIRFLHSILLFIKKRKRLMVCSAFPARSAGRSGTALCAKKNKMRDTQT